MRDNVQRPPVEFFIFNADTKAITSDVDSSTIVALDEFVQGRNDSFNFRQFICNLVVPGYIPDVVRKRLEDISNKWGMLLIGDLKDEKSFRSLSDQFRTDGGAYEFLKRPGGQGRVGRRDRGLREAAREALVRGAGWRLGRCRSVFTGIDALRGLARARGSHHRAAASRRVPSA